MIRVTSPQMRRMDEIGDESRRRILDAAEELFSEKGYEKTSFVDIATRSGISRGSIPWHFTNKDGLLIAVIERANQRHMSLDHFSEVPTFDEILERMAELAREFRGRLQFAVLTEALTSEGAVHEQYLAHYAEQRKRIAHWLKLMNVKAASREQLAVAICGSLIGVMLQWQIDPSIDLEGSYRELARMVHAALPN